jgi:hypothetical protein
METQERWWPSPYEAEDQIGRLNEITPEDFFVWDDPR